MFFFFKQKTAYEMRISDWSSDVCSSDLMLAISHAGRMLAVDLRQGARAWQAEIGGVQMPWAAGDFIYLVTNDGQLVCLLRHDGRIRWVTPLQRFADPEDQEERIRWLGQIGRAHV